MERTAALPGTDDENAAASARITPAMWVVTTLKSVLVAVALALN
jgi:hypothetical protein